MALAAVRFIVMSSNVFQVALIGIYQKNFRGASRIGRRGPTRPPIMGRRH
jgi:hypothetical protein